MTKFHVKADHVSAKYAFDGVLSSERADVLGGSAHGSVGYRGDDFAASGEFWASVAGYGCGKSATTPEAAIRILFADNGCTNIRIERVEDVRPAGAAELRDDPGAAMDNPGTTQQLVDALHMLRLRLGARRQSAAAQRRMACDDDTAEEMHFEAIAYARAEGFVIDAFCVLETLLQPREG